MFLRLSVAMSYGTMGKVKIKYHGYSLDSYMSTQCYPVMYEYTSSVCAVDIVDKQQPLKKPFI